MLARLCTPTRWIVLPLIAALLVAGCGGSKHGSSNTPTPQTAASLTVDADAVEQQIGPDGTWTAVSGTVAVHAADGLRTDATGQATLTFFTGTQVDILPGSELVISDFEQDASGKATVTLKQLTGQTLHRVSLVADSGSSYTLDTPVAHVVVRGTEFGVTVADDGATQVTVTKGTVRVEVGQQQIDVTPGQALDVDAQGVPGTPYPMNQGLDQTPVPTPSIGAILPPPASETPVTQRSK